MRSFEHFDEIEEKFFLDIELDGIVLELASPDSNESLFGPFSEPVDGAAVDERREHSESGGEGVAQGTHSQNQVDVLPDSEQILTENVHFIGLKSLFQTVSLAHVDDIFHVFVLVEIRHIA